MTDYSFMNMETGELIVEGSARNAFVENAEPFFTFLFTAECTLKVIGMGFIGEQGAYLRDPWNWLDFVVVVAGVLGAVPGVPKVSALRTFRVLRPLRSLNAIAGIKRLVTSLLKSIPELINVVAFLGILFFIFGIFGIQLWSGELHSRCRATPFPIRIQGNESNPFDNLAPALANPQAFRCVDADNMPLAIHDDSWTHDSSPWVTPRYCIWPIADEEIERVCRDGGGGRRECPVGQTCGSNYDKFGNPRFTHEDPKMAQMIMELPTHSPTFSWGITNFDHMGYAFLTIFQCITMEGWTDIMYLVQDAGFGFMASIYFVLLILIGSFFMLNLTLAVIWDNFAQANVTADEMSIARAEEERRESIMKGIYDQESSKMRLAVRSLVENRWFTHGITFLILLNTVTLSLDQYPSDTSLEFYVEVINFILTIFFTIETSLKIIGFHLKVWANSKLNLFDGFIVFVSLLELVIAPPAFMITSRSSGAGGALSALRTFRLFRIFKLARSWTSLQDLLVTMIKTVGQIGNFSVLLVLFMYIYSLIGMQFFAYKFRFDADGYPVDKDYVDAKIPRENFDNLLSAFVTIFQILTAENWNTVMYNGWRSTNWTAVFYFVSLVVLGNFIVLNLFLAILLGNFQSDEEDEPVTDRRPTTRRRSSLSDVSKVAKVIVEQKLRSNRVVPEPAPTKKLEPIRDASFKEDHLSKPNSPTTSTTDMYTRTLTGYVEPQRKKAAIIERRTFSALVPDGTSPFMRARKSFIHAISDAHLRRKIPNTKSLFLFGPGNPFRLILAKITLSQTFENMVLTLIIMSSITLAVDSPLNDPDSTFGLILQGIDFLFTVVFTIELCMKVVVFGFVLHKHSYLRNGWNILDFCIVIISLLSLQADGNAQLKSLRSLRTFRALRPLRMISRAPGLKLVVNSLFASIPQILNVMMVCLLFFMIFSIVGVNYFKGRFSSCQGPEFESFNPAQHELLLQPTPWSNLSSDQMSWFNTTSAETYRSFELSPTSKQICMWLGATWLPTINQNFNNVFQGISTLFEMSTTEQWADVMYVGVDSTDIDMQPIRDNRPAWSFFFIAFMIVGSFFMMQLFVGVVIDNFNKMKEKMGNSALLTESQKQWVYMQEAMMKLKPLRRKRVPRNKYRRRCYYVAQDPSFDLTVMICIVVNTMIMSVTYFGQSDQYSEVVETANYIFAALFLVEAAVKLIGLGRQYWRDYWNIFDFLIVAASVIGIAAKLFFNVSVGSVATVARTFRVGRVFRLIKSAPTLRQLFNTLLITLPSLVNIGALLFLMYFIYSIMGMQLFAKVKYGSYLSAQANFQSFESAMLTLIRSSTGENWNGIMYDCMRTTDCVNDPEYSAVVCGFSSSPDCIPINGCGTPFALVYFTSFTLLVTFVLLNVFIAVILEGFSNEKDIESSALTEEEVGHQ